MTSGLTTAPAPGSKDVGTGQIPIAAALRTAHEIGVKHYFIEDESPSELEQIPQSIKFLESLSW